MSSSGPPLPFHVVDLDAELACTPAGEAAATSRDADDEAAAAIIEALLEAGLLELVTHRSRAGVEGKLAHLLSQGITAPDQIAEALIAAPGVAELYADDDTLGALLDDRVG